MIKRPEDAFPLKRLVDEYVRLGELPGWCTVELVPGTVEYQAKLRAPTWLEPYLTTGAEYLGAVADVAWVANPISAYMSEAQFQALSRVDVPLKLSEVELPFPTVLVEMPPGKTHDYVIAHRYSEELLILKGASNDNRCDITTALFARPDRTVDEGLQKFDSTISDEEGEGMLAATRAALNFLLAMANFGCQCELLFPKDVERDRRLAARGDRAASGRLRRKPRLLTLARDVVLHHEEGPRPESTPTGREVSTHWRRGHWANQPHGPGRSLRKRVLRRPVLVRADLGAPLPTSYRRP